ncbi:MAG: DUF2142 domain-containing protein [Bacteroidota bacterium]|nr:DUF2142 domain-containing protein [Bacteroidota bacterium]
MALHAARSFTNVSFLLTSAKLAYCPLLLLFFLIPASKFQTRKQYWLVAGSVFFVALITLLGWTNSMSNLYTPYSEYNSGYRDGLDLMPGANANLQLHYLAAHTMAIFDVFLNSMGKSSEMYAPGYIGTFGWLDIHLPAWLIVTGYVIIVFVSITGDNEQLKFRKRDRFLLAGTLLLLLVLIIFSQHLTWDPVGGDRVMLMQGRYFIPVFPLAFLLIASFISRRIKMAGLVVLSFTLLSSCVSFHTIYRRFYKDPIADARIVHCGAEEVYHYDYLVTDQPDIFLEGSGARVKEKARTGFYALRLGP